MKLKNTNTKILITSNKFLLSEKYKHIYFIPNKTKINQSKLIDNKKIIANDKLTIFSFILPHHNLSIEDGKQLIDVLNKILNINKEIFFIKNINFKNFDLQSLIIKPITILFANI